VEVLLREGPEAAANQFNRRQPPPETPEPGPEQPREVGA